MVNEECASFTIFFVKNFGDMLKRGNRQQTLVAHKLLNVDFDLS